MNILFTAAVDFELQCAREAYRMLPGDLQERLTPFFEETGVGSVSTAYSLTRLLLSGESYDAVINLGLAGSYTPEYGSGQVVEVSLESFGDLGVETKDGFQTLFDYSQLAANTIPFVDGALHNRSQTQRMKSALSFLPKVPSVSVETISSLEERCALRQSKFSPVVESMEGASFFYVSIMEKLPFAEIRSISNFVGERDKAKWNTSLALTNLRQALYNFLKDMAICE